MLPSGFFLMYLIMQPAEIESCSHQQILIRKQKFQHINQTQDETACKFPIVQKIPLTQGKRVSNNRCNAFILTGTTNSS